MIQQRKKTKRPTETLTSRVRKIELTFKEMESQLKQAISKLEARAERFKESEQRISEQIIDLQNQIRENRSTGPNPENLITLEEGYAVNLEELEKRMEEKYSLLAERERELQELQKRISAEFEGLRAEIKGKDLLLAARENLLQNQGGSKKRGARLVSFLVDIGKKH
jgi:chaperonin cofactor prefoldin